MRIHFLLLCLTALASQVYARLVFSSDAHVKTKSQVEKFFTQRLNHFDTSDLRTYEQRYFVLDTYWKKPSGPILLNICGEYTCPGVMPGRGFPVVLAEKFNALIVSVEHRFWGKSIPFEDLSTENFKYLSTELALADLAYFIQQYQKEINQNFSLPESHKNKWFAVGGSYPGAMSAWFRLKYPHLVVGALSSSGVVKAILEFTEFDRQIARSAGPECASALREATKEIENNVAYSKVLFEAQNISDHDFWFYIADSAVEAIQYGHRHELCDQMLLAKSQGNSLAKQFANYTVNYFSKVMSSPPESYSSDIMADPKVDPLQGGRQWWWMTCTELAYFQIAPERDSIRSSKVTLEWHRQNCIKLFGEEVVSRTFPPDVEHTNAIYGGLDIHATNIYFTNGVEDPWQWASIRKTNRPGLDADVIDCEQCAHCQDLHTPSPDDAPALVHAREKFIRLLSSWLEMEPEHSEQYSTKIIL